MNERVSEGKSSARLGANTCGPWPRNESLSFLCLPSSLYNAASRRSRLRPVVMIGSLHSQTILSRHDHLI